MRRATLAVLICGFLTTLGFMFHAGEPQRLSWWPLFVPFAAWAGVPYALVYAASRRGPATTASHAVVFLSALAVSGFSALMLYQAFIAHPDAQSGIVLLFIPFYQVLGLLPLLWVARVLARRGP
ncbi:MAG: hypothetical protein OEU49_04465 [Chromatiales bacterium]|nr:hypothetical protein [Chromatiales bacterium]